ncbi:tRNA lysidine(34) synthetase TilS [Roseomonas xinghualingensis]|uniref:tRNA lysidine(34) synthetase TilS n=1 Tax=Roseomonas xinghualingensis TaxID=2986475 RepID=UPI0021F11393|nr:tRNA lysidine(34) synthetase TilS [Roseomonas sp. SXEYE001]MCV4207349.1 tRNA lysidine(34) synthetase TilS [Roseomonas sp. SXEYE001]
MAGLGPFGPAPTLAVGVSGGPHSLALAVLTRDWVAARGGRMLGLVADHGLRAESALEATGVAARLAGIGIPARVLPLGLPAGPGLHERARAARLSALLGAAEAGGAPWLLLGHHMADQAETIAFRALRGSGPDGLSGMAMARPAGGALILRPLLGVTPARIERFLSMEGLEPVRDPSNEDPRFARARLRRMLGDPGGEGPGVAALAAAAEAFATRRVRMRRAVVARLAEAACFHEEGWARLDPAALGRDAVAAAALSALVRAVGGSDHPPAREALAALLARGGGSLGGALWHGQVLCREPARCAQPVPALPGTLWDGRWRVVSAPEGSWVGALGPGGPRGRLPALVAAGLPAIRDAGRRLLSIPALDGGARLEFRPVSGPIA